MSSRSPSTKFAAVLVFEDDAGWRSSEAHVYTGTHPEVAYQLALARGREGPYGRRFVGLAELERRAIPHVSRPLDSW
jgi:hypothetical protein